MRKAMTILTTRERERERDEARGRAHTVGWDKFNKRFLYINLLIAVGVVFVVIASAFTGPGAGTPPAQNATGIIPLSQGGTGVNAASTAAARSALGAAGSGTNSDIASLSGLTTPLSVAQGGTGANTLTGLLLGNGTATIGTIAPGTSGNVLASNGTTWASSAPASGSKFGGTGADGALNITSGTTTLDLGASSFFIRNYTSMSITGTGKLAFTNPGGSGTVIMLKSQGDVTVTSSTVPAVDASNMGSTGGGGIATFAAPPGGNSPSGNGCFCGACTQALASSGVGTPTSASQYGRALIIWAGGSGGGNGGGGAGCTAGGRGGGGVYIEAKGNLNITSTFWAKGQTGGNYIVGGACSTIGGGGGGGSFSGGAGGSDTNAGGCGGGGGGMFYILYNGTVTNTATFDTSGGAGGTAGGGIGGSGTSVVQLNTTF